MLYQLSHFRPFATAATVPPVGGAESQIRTGDTVIFSHVLYQLSYLGTRPEAFRQRGRLPAAPVPQGILA